MLSSQTTGRLAASAGRGSLGAPPSAEVSSNSGATSHSARVRTRLAAGEGVAGWPRRWTRTTRAIGGDRVEGEIGHSKRRGQPGYSQTETGPTRTRSRNLLCRAPRWLLCVQRRRTAERCCPLPPPTPRRAARARSRTAGAHCRNCGTVSHSWRLSWASAAQQDEAPS